MREPTGRLPSSALVVHVFIDPATSKAARIIPATIDAIEKDGAFDVCAALAAQKAPSKICGAARSTISAGHVGHPKITIALPMRGPCGEPPMPATQGRVREKAVARRTMAITARAMMRSLSNQPTALEILYEKCAQMRT